MCPSPLGVTEAVGLGCQEQHKLLTSTFPKTMHKGTCHRNLEPLCSGVTNELRAVRSGIAQCTGVHLALCA